VTLHPLPHQLVPGDTVADPTGERTVEAVHIWPALTRVDFTDGSSSLFTSDVPVTRGRLACHLHDAHHVATVPATGLAEHLHRVLHDTAPIRVDHDHKAVSL